MTTVILAKTYADAAEVARGIGAGHDWLYPHRPEMLQGVVIQRLVYVEGWMHSTHITVETAEWVQLRLAPNARVLTLKPGGPRAEAQAAVSAPFVTPVAQEPLPEPRGRQRGRGRLSPTWVSVLIVVVVGSAGVAAGHFAVRLGQAWGWW